jgi:hypothetical protein
VQDCHSSKECEETVEEGGGEGGGGGIGGGIGGQLPEKETDSTLATPTDLSVAIGPCGTLNAQSSDNFVTINFSWTGDADGFDFQVSRGNTFNIIELQHVGMVGNSVKGNLPINSLFFFRVRSKHATSDGYGEWSSVLMFRTDVFIDDCSGVLPPIETPEYLEVICPEGVPPSGPPEPPTEVPNPETPEPENPDPDPAPPTPPGGPDPCEGDGCGDGGPNGGPNSPNPLPPPDVPLGPDCIGPGCDGDDGPGGGDGPSGPGGPGGPGGEDPDSPEVPPTVPPPQIPRCLDEEVHNSFVIIENLGTEDIGVIIRWDARESGCGEYLDSIGEEDYGKVVNAATMAGGETKRIELGLACPECLEICVTGNSVPYRYIIWTSVINDNGEIEVPVKSGQTEQVSKPICGCDGYSILDVVYTRTKNSGGVTSSYGAAATPINNSDITIALRRELEPSEGCFQFTELQSENGNEQVRTKLACYDCDGRSFIEITSSILLCEVGFFERYKDDLTSRIVSFQNHWDMSSRTHEYSKKTWPDTSIDEWQINANPVLTGWSKDTDTCITCCELESTITGKPHIGGAVNGYTGVSVASELYPYNNSSCIGNSVKDPNFNGSTGGFGPDPYESTAVGACRPPLATTTIVDNLNSVASTLSSSDSQLGFAQVTAQDVQDIIDALAVCNGTDCNSPLSNDFTYLINYTNVTFACQTGTGDPAPELLQYKLLGAGVNVEIEARQVGGGGCGQGLDRYYSCGLQDVGAYPGVTVSQGGGDTDVWDENSFFWTRDTIAADGRRVGAVRYEVTNVQVPFQSGGGSNFSMNPLP